MKWKKLYSVSSLLSAAVSIAQRCETVTFDLFDTLLVRGVHDPDLVKLPVARFIADLAATHGRRIGWQHAQEIRDRVEQEQRAETGSQFDDHEACYPVFMERSLKEIFSDKYSESILRKVTEYELKMENSMLVPRQELVEWLKELK